MLLMMMMMAAMLCRYARCTRDRGGEGCKVWETGFSKEVPNLLDGMQMTRMVVMMMLMVMLMVKVMIMIIML